jgi:hypothetical protein
MYEYDRPCGVVGLLGLLYQYQRDKRVGKARNERGDEKMCGGGAVSLV